MSERMRQPAFRSEEEPAEKAKRTLNIQLFRHRKMFRLLIGVAGTAVLLLLICSVSIRGLTVSGNRHYTDHEIEEMVLTGPFARSSVLTYLRFHLREHRSIPFVEDYRIAFRSPVEAEIIVYEKSIVGYVSYMGSNMYFDKDGVVVESTSEVIEGVPRISGLHFGHIVLNRPLPVENEEVFDQILNLTQILSTSGILTDRINYDDNLNSTLYIKNLIVRLGGRENMGEKLLELKDILAEYPDLDGTLYLDSYDESNSNPLYRFEKNN